MSAVFAIFKKEFRGFVLSPSFLFICGTLTVLLSGFFTVNLYQFKNAAGAMMFGQMGGGDQMNIHYALFMKHLSMTNLLMIVLVPALTMRLFSEEKKMRTMDLLMTSPITSAQIVAGKYLAALAAVALIVILALAYPVSTAAFAKLNWGPLLIAFFGIFLVGGVYAATNLFCSALTESAIIAFFLAVFMNFLVWFIGMGAEVADSATARSVFEHISLNSHLSSMALGTIRSSSLVFFASLIFLFGFLCERVIEASRWR